MNLNRMSWDDLRVFLSVARSGNVSEAGGQLGLVMLPLFARCERFGLREILVREVDVRRDIWMSSHRYLQRVPRIRAVANFLAEIIGRDFPPPRVV
jgi:DNA-binding transcriptional LysR family regulator